MREPDAERPRAVPILLALAAALLFAGAVFATIDLRTDMADFLPRGQTDASRFMLREIREGSITSLILVGIEGAPAADLARISQAMAAGLEKTGLFTLVGNGKAGVNPADVQFLFAHRYLLSPATVPAAFTVAALRADFSGLLRQLQSSAAPLAQQFGLPDPPGAFAALAKTWVGASKVRVENGVWFAPAHDRALLLAKTRAGGMDIGAQDQVDAAIHAAFTAAEPGQARLLVSGPAVFARGAAHAIRSDIRTLSIVSTLLIAGLLFWRFRSLWVIAAIAVPVAVSVAVAALAVQAVFGFVHGIAFGFGMTMLGVSVDYPVLLIGHRKRGEPPAGTLARIGATFALAVVTAALGLTGMVFSGFPGLAQLGVFSVVGLVSAALATRFVLPGLVTRADLAPVESGDAAAVLRIERLRAWRRWALLPVAAAAIYLAAIGGPAIEGDLAAMSPVPQSARDLDAELRRDLGVPDVGQVAVLQAPTADAVLLAEEALLPALDRLVQSGALTGAEIAARFLPSAATQRARQAALPASADLGARVAEAATGLPFRPEAFAPFIAAVADNAAMAPLTLADITSPTLAARLEPLLFQRDGIWYGLVAPAGLTDPAAFQAAMGRATLVDMHAETNGIVAQYMRRAWRWLGAGAVAAIIALAIGLRDAARVLRVAGAIAAAGLITVAVLSALGIRQSLLHVVSLQFVAGVGLDYALFFARIQLDAEERARTLRTLVTCNAMTLLTFGLLALCRTPLLRDIGLTVAIGAFTAMCCAFLFAGPKPAAA